MNNGCRLMASSLTISRRRQRASAEGIFRFGIEEEYFLADAETLRPPRRTPDGLFKQLAGSEICLRRELLQSQIEVATRPHDTIRAARDELKLLRNATSDASSKYGLKILACGTSPLAEWRRSVHSPKRRYEKMMDDLQMLARRNMLCGMHVHVELPDPSRRVEIMARMLRYIPVLLALSTSSPFWEKCPTGLMGYRLTAYDELPRTGLPELFATEGEFEEYVGAMQRSDAIADASHLWWSIRPSPKYPTLELRATDCCTRMEDALAIASLYRVLVRHLYRCPDVNADVGVIDRALALENKWRAQRFGSAASFVTREGAVSLADTLRQLFVLVEPDADVLGCLDALDHCQGIIAGGTSADAQLRIFGQHAAREPNAALVAVAGWIAEATLA
ncbi:MAG TPA: carboxylate-amine ligase [Beijerinckiaceae bacterium]|nr:carboxylate-amine ligase [Beijerinckiaceae bacterium]